MYIFYYVILLSPCHYNNMDINIKILFASSDSEIIAITNNYLVSRGFNTVVYENGKDVLQHFEDDKPDFLLIDVNLDLISGFEIVRETRKTNHEIPIILIGNNTSHDDAVIGLRYGADDFMTRPVSLEELGLRIDSILKRLFMYSHRHHIYKFGNYTVDTRRHMLIIGKKERRLTTKEMDLLLLFLEYKNRVVERKVALKRIWYQENYFNARNMDVYIKKLRTILGDDPNIKLENVHGVGYKLVIYYDD